MIPLVLTLAGCGRQTQADLIANGLQTDVLAIKHGDTQKMQDYFGFDPSQAFVDDGVTPEDFGARFFKDLAVEVTDVQISDTNATANVTVTSNDYASCQQRYQDEVTSYLLENGNMADAGDADVQAQAASLYLSAMASDDVPPVTHDIQLSYELSDKTWMLQNPEAFADAVFGDAFVDPGQTGVYTETGVGATASEASSSAEVGASGRGRD